MRRGEEKCCFMGERKMEKMENPRIQDIQLTAEPGEDAEVELTVDG